MMERRRGDLVTIDFGGLGASWALVTGYNRNGRLMGRRWSASHGTYGKPQRITPGDRTPGCAPPAKGAVECDRLNQRDAEKAAKLEARVEAAKTLTDGQRVIVRDETGAITLRGRVDGDWRREGYVWVRCDGERCSGVVAADLLSPEPLDS